jgi:phosphatidylserine/phosphatidylglycerophosphate/cardiolipin synthase-like enzyme
MELLHEPRMARKILAIFESKREILVLTSPQIVRLWSEEQTDALAGAAKAGLDVKIYLNQKALFPLARLSWLQSRGVKIRAGGRRLLGCDSSTEDEIFIFDREHALGGNRHLCKELRAQPEGGRLGIECPLPRAAAKTAARYFDHRWEGHPEGVALVVRHQEFFFRGGKGAEREFLLYASRAQKEITLCLTDARLSPVLCKSLHAALRRGVQVRLFSNSFGIRSLRSRVYLGRLLRAGAVLRLTAGHLPLASVCALVDGFSVYLGALPGSVRRVNRIPRPVFFLHDRELASNLTRQLERQVGRQISRGNSVGLRQQSRPSLAQRVEL